jgi:hypothetical protein
MAAFTDLKATATIRGKVVEKTFELALDAWTWLRDIRDEQEAMVDDALSGTARRLHQIAMTIQAFDELDGTGAVFGPVPGESDADDPDHIECCYRVEFAS